MTELPSLPPFKSISYCGPRPGPRFIVLGAVHGNETCGTRAIGRIAAALDAGELVLAAGTLTLVPIANRLAYARGTRIGDRNLNRALAPTATPREFEDHVANWLCPLLAAHEVLLDLHSFNAAGQPFVMVGPCDNDGPIEPFTHAAREEALARRLGVARAVDGWLGTYAVGVQRRRERVGPVAAARLDLDPRYGVGTTEYMRQQGGCALTLECGQHADPQAPQVAENAVRAALAVLGMVDAPLPAPAAAIESLHLGEVIDRLHADDRFVRPWRSFDALEADTLIGWRHDGQEVRAPRAGRIVFPNEAARVNEEWFYLAVESARFG